MICRCGVVVEDDFVFKELVVCLVLVCILVGKIWVFYLDKVMKVLFEENFGMIMDLICFLRVYGKCVVYDVEYFFDVWWEDFVYVFDCL